MPTPKRKRSAKPTDEGPSRKWQPGEKLIIALDFGTTFSGIAYCFVNQRDSKVAAIVDWPGAEGEAVPKIPTLINYFSPDGKSFAWGASVHRMQDSIVGVKLLLDPSQEMPLYLPSANHRRAARKLPKPVVNVAADFIGAIYRHALKEIAKEVPKGYFELCKKHFVLSVPAVWSDKAKNATLEAAKIAGISPVTLIKEPEAASLYILRSLDFSLTVGDTFVICDAGGGTVDMISYEVVAVSPKLELKELVPGSGGMAGSLGLNQRFEDAVKTLVGEDQYADLRKMKGYHLGVRTFDREVKRAFKGGEDEEYFVHFPMCSLEDDIEAGLDSNCWRLTGVDLKAMFAPLITDILRLIDDQINAVKKMREGKGITGICLAGGFGSNHYLKSQIENRYSGIHVLQPTDAWAAIVKGAALSELPQEAAVVAISATKHYGVQAGCIYKPRIDIDVPTYTDYFTGEKRAERMTWYIKIGDVMCRDQTIRFPFCRSFNEDYTPEHLLLEDTLYHCEDLEAPLHKTKGNKIGRNCILHSDLRSVPKKNFVKATGINGKPYFEINYDLVVSFNSALMTFSLEIDGKSWGSVEPKFE